nr:UxaA family hydrolase [Edaphobacter aggregans]
MAKGGSSPLRAVVRYADPLPCRGLVFMDSPGYDPVSATGQIASGANLPCFTTGRGSVFGAKPVPSLKLSTTTWLYPWARQRQLGYDTGEGDQGRWVA